MKKKEKKKKKKKKGGGVKLHFRRKRFEHMNKFCEKADIYDDSWVLR